MTRLKFSHSARAAIATAAAIAVGLPAGAALHASIDAGNSRSIIQTQSALSSAPVPPNPTVTPILPALPDVDRITADALRQAALARAGVGLPDDPDYPDVPTPGDLPDYRDDVQDDAAKVEDEARDDAAKSEEEAREQAAEAEEEAEEAEADARRDAARRRADARDERP